jgi:hypothetical protein
MQKRLSIALFILFFSTTITVYAQNTCKFEKSNGLESATYFEAIDWYKNLDTKFNQVLVKEMGMTDAGYPK